MNLFGSRHRHRPEHPVAISPVPAGGGGAVAQARFADPVAQATHPRAADAVGFGGVTLRAEEGEVR